MAMIIKPIAPIKPMMVARSTIHSHKVCIFYSQLD
jgi:hypothetical protein